MSSGKTAEDKAWQSREQAEEARYVHAREQAQLAALREQVKQDLNSKNTEQPSSSQERDFEGGFGGQEDLEDRYATTSGEH